jgi:type III pantothenate kinase
MAVTCLALDIGNSRIKAALLHRGHPVHIVSLRTRSQLRRWRQAHAELPLYVIDTRKDPAWTNLLSELGGRPLEITDGVPFPTSYASTLGPDRCAALCALFYIAQKPLLYLSFGTALTGDVLDAQDTHLGGFISLGLALRLKALHQHTGRLPRLSSPPPSIPAWGTSTPEAIWIGAFHGMLSEIQSHLKRAQETLGSHHLYISGGEAPLFQPFLPQPLTFVPNLTLIGVWHWQNFLFGE